MEQKRSGVGIAAGAVYCIPLLNAIFRLLIMIRDTPQMLAMPYLLDRIPDLMGLCQMAFIIVSLFGNRRSRLLLAACILMDLQMVWGLVVSGIHFDFSLYTAMNVLNYATTILMTAMVVCICVPSLREKAGWTGKVWFLPAVCNGVMNVLNLVVRFVYDLDMSQYPPIVLIMGIVLSFPIMVVWYLLFGLWLTEAVRHKEIN